jgi:hypothetical protein
LATRRRELIEAEPAPTKHCHDWQPANPHQAPS